MKKKLASTLSLILGFGLISCSSKPAANSPAETPRIPAASVEKLPSTFHKHGVGTEIVQTNYCWIVKIDRSEADLQRYFMPDIKDPRFQLTDEDIGKYTVLGEINYNGFGGDGYPKIRDLEHKAVSYDEALHILETHDDCTEW